MTIWGKLTCCTLALLLLLAAPITSEADEFDFIIVPTLDNQLDSWLKIPAELGPTIHIPDRLYPNQPFSLRLLFKNYALSSVKNAHITYELQIFGPDGKPTADRGENLLGYNGPVKSKHYILINQQQLVIYFDENYPVGDYGIKVIARDHLANKTVVKSGKIEFASFKRVANFVSFDFFSYWVRNYFRQPDVGKAIFGYLQYFEDNPQWLQSNLSLLAFTNKLLDDNPWLWDHLARLYKDNPTTRDKIIALMALNNHPMPRLTAAFSNKQKAYFARLKEMQLPEPAKDTKSSEQIALLWGDFYATGNLAPLKQIVRVLKPFELTDQPDENFDPGKPEQVAFQTLVEHAKEIPLVISFCTYLLEHGKLAQENAIQLRLILKVLEKALADEQSTNPAPE